MRDPYDPYADERAMADAAAEAQAQAEAAANQRAHEAMNRAKAITECTMCDPDGYHGTTICDHTDHTQAAARGMARLRAKMGWPATRTPDTP